MDRVNKKLESSTQKLEDINRMVAEIEEQAKDVHSVVVQQGIQIRRSRQKLEDINNNISIGSSIINRMSRWWRF